MGEGRPAGEEKGHDARVAPDHADVQRGVARRAVHGVQRHAQLLHQIRQRRPQVPASPREIHVSMSRDTRVSKVSFPEFFRDIGETIHPVSRRSRRSRATRSLAQKVSRYCPKVSLRSALPTLSTVTRTEFHWFRSWDAGRCAFMTAPCRGTPRHQNCGFAPCLDVYERRDLSFPSQRRVSP